MIAMTENDKVLTTNDPIIGSWKKVNNISDDDALGVFDFEIYKKQSYAYDPQTGIARVIPNHYHLERSIDSEIIPSASIGAQFTPVQHRDLYAKVRDEIMPAMPDAKLEMVATFHGGGTGIIALKMGDTYQIKGDNSPQITRLLIANPSNGTGRVTLGYTNVRIVCQNTLMASIRQANGDGWKVKHTKNIAVKCDSVIKEIRASVDAAIEMRERCNLLASIGANRAMIYSALDAVLPLYGLEVESPAYNHVIEKRNEVVRQFESGETAQTMSGKTAWTLFNAFTFPVFNPSRISKKTDLSQIQYSGMVGDTARKVRDIFETVSEVALAAV